MKPNISDVSVGFTTLARVAPLELLMIAGSVPEHECLILDMRLEPDEAFERELVRFVPDIVGITAYSAEAVAAKDLARRAKRVCPGVPIVWGGVHATMATRDALAEPAVDCAVLGEGEATFPELVAALLDGAPRDALARIPGVAFRQDEEVVISPPRSQIEDLDTLPFPDWSLVKTYQSSYYLNVMGRMASVESTRGCPFSCSFCSVWQFHRRRYRKKSPARVLEELSRLPAGTRVAAFVDDEFWVDAGRSLELARLIQAQPPDWPGRSYIYWAQVRTDDIVRTPELVAEWAAAGLRVLLLGIESCKDEELANLHHKRNTVANSVEAIRIMRRHDVEAWGCFIVNPGWGEADFHELAEFVRTAEIAFPQFTVLTPLPGTVLTQEMHRRGELDAHNLPLILLDFLHAVTPTRLPLARFYELLAELYRNTSMAANRPVFRRALRSGVINREWLRSETGRQVSHFLSQLGDARAYLRAHKAVQEGP